MERVGVNLLQVTISSSSLDLLEPTKNIVMNNVMTLIWKAHFSPMYLLCLYNQKLINPSSNYLSIYLPEEQLPGPKQLEEEVVG